jgi:hypothetical protein
MACGGMPDTIVYVDGFNLYYRALRGTAHKWLDLIALSQAVLPAANHITPDQLLHSQSVRKD